MGNAIPNEKYPRYLGVKCDTSKKKHLEGLKNKDLVQEVTLQEGRYGT